MLWQGPKKDGITQSLCNRFMGDDGYRNYMYLGLGLEEYSEVEPNLAYGDTGHYGLEHLIEKEYTIPDFTPEDWEEIRDAMEHKLSNEYPDSPRTYLTSLMEMLPLYDDNFKKKYGRFVTELDFAIPYTTGISKREVTLRGKIDALNILPESEATVRRECMFGEREFKKIPSGFVPGPVIGEHKFKGKIDAGQAMLEIPVDLQVAIYCYASGARRVIYDNIRIPDTQWSLPPKRNFEKKGAYIKSLYHDRVWGDFPVAKKKPLWISQHDLEITDEMIERTFKFTLDPLIDHIFEWYEHCSQPGFDPEDPKFYNSVFWRKPVRTFDGTRTQSFKCNYHGLLTGQITPYDLEPVGGFYQELPDEKDV